MRIYKFTVFAIAIFSINHQTVDCNTTPSTTQTPQPSTVLPPTTPYPRNVIHGYSFKCDFENDSCKALGHPTWRKYSGSTPSLGTGPSDDATPGSFTKHYVYYEASHPESFGDLRSLLLRFEGRFLTGSGCLKFWYHMFGQNIGSLRVYLRQNKTIKLLTTISGSQGNSWHSTSVSLGVVPPSFFLVTQFDVIFEAENGGGYRGDIALDDIEITPSCTGTPITTIPSTTFSSTRTPNTTTSDAFTTPSANYTNTPTSTNSPITTAPNNSTNTTVTSTKNPFTNATASAATTSTSSPPTTSSNTTHMMTTTIVPLVTHFKCDFERDSCNPTVNTRGYWIKRRGQTPSVQTGPYIDNTKGDSTGYYIHIEASYSLSQKKYLEYRISNTQSSNHCLRFAYHMYGSSIGTLTVGYRMIGSSSFTSIWRKSGNKGDIWQQTEVTFNTKGSFNLVFEVSGSTHFQNDIAIDDIHVTNYCPKPGKPPATKTVFLPYGRLQGDRTLPSGTGARICLTMPKAFPLFTVNNINNLCIYARGYVSVGNKFSTSRFSLPTSFSSFAAYHQDFTSTNNIHYRLTSDPTVLASIDNDVALVLGKQPKTPKAFKAKSAVIVTYDKVSFNLYSGSTARFQTIIATDWQYTFTITNYDYLQKNAKFAGFYDTTCKTTKMLSRPSLTSKLADTSNVDIKGKHVYLMTNSDCINRQVLYPYGSGTSDRLISSSISFRSYLTTLTGDWAFFSRPLRPALYVNSMGYINVDNVYFNPPTTTATYIAPYYHKSQSSTYRVYFREINNTAILDQATSDIKSSHSNSAFVTKDVFIVTFLSKNYQYQVVLATDGNETYSIMNYQQLLFDAQHVGMNEIGCGLKKFTPSFNSAKSLINGSTNGIRGRHVFPLTTRGCYKRVTGVRHSESNDFISGMFPNLTFTYQVLKRYEISRIVYQFTEASVFMDRNFVILIPSYANDSQLSVLHKPHRSYLSMYSSSELPKRIRLNNLYVLLGTKQTRKFQYGSIDLITVDSKVECHTIKFHQKMSSLPAVKVIQNSKGLKAENFVYLWIKDVTTLGFTVCSKEVIGFSGPRTFNISYIAASNSDNTVSEISHVFIKKSSNTNCIKQEFKHLYISSPSVVTTIEKLDGGNSELVVSWVKDVTEKNVEVCYRSTIDEPLKVHLIVKGRISPCSGFSCPDHLECKLNNNSQRYCGCITKCIDGEGRGEFCGSDYKTYGSICHLNSEHCIKFGNESKANLTVLHYGKCQIKPFQAGRTQLQAIPELSGVFCKYINIDSGRFLPVSTSPPRVLLTVSWNKQSFTVTNDASASWSENVTANGFKACALISGRHANSDFKNSPMVHWTVFQEQFFSQNTALFGGTKNLETWYTGTQCKLVHSLGHSISSQIKVFTSVYHSKLKNYQNAITVWSETRKTIKATLVYVCARELQNFDGKHEGIVVHWLIYNELSKTPFDLYIPEQLDITFPRKSVILGKSNPVECKSVPYNFRFPSLQNPTIIIGGGNTKLSTSTTSKTVYSQHNFALWIEETSQSSLTVCMKSVDTSSSNVATRPEMTISALVIASLCEDENEIFHDNSCYHKLPGCESNHLAHAKCLVKGSDLPVISNEAEQVFLQERISSATWIGLRRTPPNMEWVWNDGSTLNYTKWFPGQPANISEHNCAVMDERGVAIGWQAENCSACKHTYCEKDSNLVERSCKQFCLNGGKCQTNGDKRNVTCQCPDEMYGVRCEFNVTPIEGCSNYTTHTEGWRHIRNTTNNNVHYKSGCDGKYLNDGGWHRFSGDAGSKIFAGSCVKKNSCGTTSPGWISNISVPLNVGDLGNANLHFHTFFCADDFGAVDIRHCGNFFTYRFTNFPYWSCNYGVCTQ